MSQQQELSKETNHQSWREGFLRNTLILASVFGIVALIPAILSSTLFYSGIYISIYLLLLLATLLPVNYQVRTVLLIVLLYGLAVSGMTEVGILGDARLFMLGAITMSALLFSWRAGLVMTIIALLTYIVFGWLILNGEMSLTNPTAPAPNLNGWITASTSLLLLSVLVVNGIRLTQTEFRKAEDNTRSLLSELRKEQTYLEERVEERTQTLDKRTAQLRAVAEVGKSITSYRNLSDLLQQTTYLIHENFGYYHVGIFLLDNHKEYAVLTATNSEGGRRMLEKGHQLKVGETGIVGFVAENLQARIALDVGADAVFFNNPDLPNTRSEMALPLVATGQILGVLDVQSTEPQAFTEDDVATIQILAEQIAVAIQNTNLFSETEKALESARVAYGEFSREAWSKILRNQPKIGFIATPPTTLQTGGDAIEPSLAKAIDSGDLILSTDGLSISVPIKIRGQVIGAIRLKKPEIAEAWSQDETNLAITLSDQLSSALESARLYRESQQRAVRESLVSDISTRLSTTTTIDSILRETVQELGEALGNASVTFQLIDSSNGRRQFEDPEGGA
ncbi:MAG TPA: GAF domain-containing protein [Anaerolineales bacterium]|nr:GAF domain-containing protein [Anaerolineales bacterium]